MSDKRRKQQQKELDAAIGVQSLLEKDRINYNLGIVPPPIIQEPTEEVYQSIQYNEKLLKDNFLS